MVFQLYPIAEGRISGLIFFLIAIIYTVYFLTTKKVPYIRRVPAIDAIEEGIGRATELGKPVIVSPGMSPRGIDTSTAAGLSILSHVSQLAARNDLKLIAPLGGSSESYTTMELARDIVESQYRLEGKPESYNVDNMPFLSGRQFAWASAYCGLMLREKPATNIMVGVQYASAVYISEVAHETGAMVISGTTYLSNIACLAASSDYVMIGEEMLAAGAYLSKDPKQLATIRTQDIMKFVLLGILGLGVITLSFGSELIIELLSS
jgi:hypothetical protein